jgi:hypothetical protein
LDSFRASTDRTLIDADHAEDVLRACGLALQELHGIDITTIFPDSSNREQVLTHGDFGPNNVLLDAETFAVTADLDWEFSSPGDALVAASWLGTSIGFGENPCTPRRKAPQAHGGGTPRERA